MRSGPAPTQVAVAALMVAAAASVLFLTNAPGADRPVGVALPPAARGPTPELASRFQPWPPLVLAWHVTGRLGKAPSLSNSSLAWNPCGALGTADCHVQFAFGSFDQWSLAASVDPVFDSTDVWEITAGDMYYGVLDGAVVAVDASGRVPPLGPCDRLLGSHHAGEPIAVETSRITYGDWAAVTLTGPDGESAECLGPSGLPVRFAELGRRWHWTRLDVRMPTSDELGVPLVAGAGGPSAGCGGPLGAFDPSTSGVWLEQIAAAAGFEVTGAHGPVISLDDGTGRSVVAWTTTDAVADGARRRVLSDGSETAEFIHPQPALSVAVGQIRVWIMSGEAPGNSSRIALEQDAYELGELLVQLVAGASRYAGPLPAGC